MRTETIDYINTLSLGGFYLTEELPWDADGNALYLKNPKKIYIDATAYTTDPLIQTLDALTINNETTSVRIYFACDAKQLPSNYDTLVSDLRSVKNIAIDGVQNRTVTVSTDYQADLLVTRLEVRFTKLST